MLNRPDPNGLPDVPFARVRLRWAMLMIALSRRPERQLAQIIEAAVARAAELRAHDEQLELELREKPFHWQ